MSKNIDKQLKDLRKRVSALEVTVSDSPVTKAVNNQPQEKIPVNEFLKTKKLKNDVERALAIAYWLDYFEKVHSFNASDIEKLFRAARLSVPQNINDKINMNIKNGSIAEHKEKKEGKKSWYVTNTGAELVENALEKEKTQ